MHQLDIGALINIQSRIFKTILKGNKQCQKTN
jgi:hypothetical protein